MISGFQKKYGQVITQTKIDISEKLSFLLILWLIRVKSRTREAQWQNAESASKNTENIPKFIRPIGPISETLWNMLKESSPGVRSPCVGLHCLELECSPVKRLLHCPFFLNHESRLACEKYQARFFMQLNCKSFESKLHTHIIYIKRMCLGFQYFKENKCAFYILDLPKKCKYV